MPTDSQYVPPEVFLTHQGITIFCAYKNDDVQAGPLEYWFTLDEQHGMDTPSAFDVRQLPTWQAPAHPPYVTRDLTEAEQAARTEAWREYVATGGPQQAIHRALQQAIEQGLLSPYRCPVDWCEAIVPKFLLEDEEVCPHCHEETCLPWTPPPPGTPPPRKSFLVKLEYQLEARDEREAVDTLTAAIRTTQPDAELLRTDVRRPGESGAW